MYLGAVLPGTIAGYGLATIALMAGLGLSTSILILFAAGNGVAVALGTWHMLHTAAVPQGPNDRGRSEGALAAAA